MAVKDNIRDIINMAPKKPGVYLFRDTNGIIIYAGKAKNLHGRVKSYFPSGNQAGNQSHPISYFTGKINTVDFIETDNETEALILESSLIKKNRPKYNIFLKDDKSYPYIAITESEKYPRVFLTRNRNIKGARYFGPYINARNIRETLEELSKIFQVRDCKKAGAGKIKGSVCLNYHINICCAPCTGRISPGQYRQNIEYIKMFLKGNNKSMISGLKKQMLGCSRAEEYEEAQEIKNKIELLNNLFTKQKILFPSGKSWDIIACKKDEDIPDCSLSLFKYIEGELSSINNFIILNCAHMSESEIIAGFIKSFYSEIDNMSPRLYLQEEIEDSEAISGWLSMLKSKSIDIKVPKRGEKKEIINMALKNAALYLEKKKFEKSSGYQKVFKELLRLKEKLGLFNVPKRIECFDISNIGASFAVGSMSVLIDGSASPANYRHFKIRAVQGQDDIAMMIEVLARRLKYLEKSAISIENSFYAVPDLIVIDGGKGHYNAASKILLEYKLRNIDLISIAKKEERIFCGKYAGGAVINSSDNYINFIIKARDEAHRFALVYHKKLRDKYMTHSMLDGIKGIGQKKKNCILEKFQTLDELKSCSLEDFLSIKGINYKDALNIYNSLNRY